MGQQYAWFSSSQQRLQLHELFFANKNLPFPFLPQGCWKQTTPLLTVRETVRGKSSTQPDISPCRNLQNTAVQLGGWFRVKVTYLWSSWQVLIFNLLQVTAAGLLSRMLDPSSTCLQETLFFQTHEYHLLEASKWPFESFCVLSGQGCFPSSIGQVHNSAQWKESISNFICNLQLLMQICCTGRLTVLVKPALRWPSWRFHAKDKLMPH